MRLVKTRLGASSMIPLGGVCFNILDPMPIDEPPAGWGDADDGQIDGCMQKCRLPELSSLLESNCGSIATP
jgi:hypothetical protein